MVILGLILPVNYHEEIGLCRRPIEHGCMHGGKLENNQRIAEKQEMLSKEKKKLT